MRAIVRVMEKQISLLEQARRRRFLTLRQVSVATQKAVPTVADWEKGRYNVPVELHSVLARLYKVGKHELWPDLYDAQKKRTVKAGA